MLIKWVIHDILTHQYTVCYRSGRVITYKNNRFAPDTVLQFIQDYVYSSHVGNNIIVYEA